jgi:hypothetical protein
MTNAPPVTTVTFLLRPQPLQLLSQLQRVPLSDNDDYYWCIEEYRQRQFNYSIAGQSLTF